MTSRKVKGIDFCFFFFVVGFLGGGRGGQELKQMQPESRDGWLTGRAAARLI